MQYKKRKSEPLNSLFSKLRLGSVSLPLNKMDSISNRIAFMPNFIHSMDSTNIQLLIKNYKDKKQENINLFTIHDCFATTPNYMKDLNRDVRLAFLMIYFQGDYIKTVHENFIKKIYNCTQAIYEYEENNETLQETEKLEENKKVSTSNESNNSKNLVRLDIEDVNNLFLSLNINKKYVIRTPRKYIIPSLPYNVDN